MEPAIIYHGSIKIKEPQRLFSRYGVTKKDLRLFNKLISEGKEERAIDLFIQKYMVDEIELYNAVVKDYLRITQEGEIPKKDQNKIITSIILLTGALAQVMHTNFKEFTRDTVGPEVFERQGIKGRKVKQAILEATIGQFQTLTQGAMSETQEFIISNIRKMQREIIIKNQQLYKMKGLTTEMLDREVWNFRKKAKQTMPEYFKAMEHGKILKSRKTADGRVIRYRLEDYADMATRTTVLNVDRTAVEVVAGIEKANVVEYYLRDNRPLKTGKEREICKYILSRKLFGKSVLAMDSETAAALGIMSLDEAKAQGAMGPYCRHGIKMVSNTYKHKIEKLLREKRAA